jgi:hypothetical protein
MKINKIYKLSLKRQKLVDLEINNSVSWIKENLDVSDREAVMIFTNQEILGNSLGIYPVSEKLLNSIVNKIYNLI